ncbi:MAG: DUF1800 domain-containing protein [Gemmatimonadaceae bacterium]|nr:DUF1800 domain-containing protein [Gemmatimonadaceae bacterium]
MTPVTDRLVSLAALLLVSACASSSAAPVAATPGHSPVVVVAPTEPREQTADEQVQHVLNRLAFGPRPGELAAVRATGVDQWIALQLAPDNLPDSAAARVVASYEMLGRPTTEFISMYEDTRRALRAGDSTSKKELKGELRRNDPEYRETLRRSQRVLGDVQSAKLARAIVSDRQLQEVMTDFWGNHFTVFAGKGITRLFIPAYDRDVIRPRALGNFRDLLGAVAKSPAMLFYLDQWQSAADSLHPTLAAARRPGMARGAQLGAQPGAQPGAQLGARLTPKQRQRLAEMTPAEREQLTQRIKKGAKRGLNENFARELLELHTLGVDGGYTQQDVIEVARALTGWTMQSRVSGEFAFAPAIHDAGAKRVLGVNFPAGRGIEDGEQVLDIVARHPATARYIARKLAIRFVSDAPPEALVARAAATFTRTDGDIRETVRTIVTSPEFFSRSAYRAKVKSPFELVASAMRAVGASPDTSMRSSLAVAFLGQPIFGHQAPNGWPETGDAWMNSGAILNRINFGLGLAAGRFPSASVNTWSESARLANATREQQVDAVVLAFLGGRASPDTRQILLSGENPLAAKLAATLPANTSAAPAGSMDGTMATASEPTGGEMMTDARPIGGGRPNGRPGRAGAQRATGAPVRLGGLAQVVGLAIGAPEFQRR